MPVPNRPQKLYFHKYQRFFSGDIVKQGEMYGVCGMHELEMCIVLSGKPEGDGRITLKWVINKQDNTVQTGFWWLKIRTSGGLL
jgi:hypothetical protein